MKVIRITLQDDLETLVEEINASSWDDANEMPRYDAASLTAYLQRQDTVFVACHDSEPSAILLGIASCRLEIRPHDQELWLYVDEVDGCADQRQRGVGKRIMTMLIEFADQSGCEEVWLGTEVENAPANALYQFLAPDDVANVIGYTYETD